MHHWQGLCPQVQDQQQENVLLDAGLRVVSPLLISHIMLLHRSLRLTRMKSCVRRYSSCLNFFGEIFYNKLINTVQVNENLNNPPAPGSARAGGGSGGGLPGGLPAGLDFNNLGDSELQNLLNNMSQQQLMQV